MSGWAGSGMREGGEGEEKGRGVGGGEEKRGERRRGRGEKECG